MSGFQSDAFDAGGFDAGAATAYTLIASAGTLALTGNSAGMLAVRVMPANAGAFAATGQPAGFARALRMDAGPGSFGLAYLPTSPPAGAAEPEVQQATGYATPKKRARHEQPSLRMASDEPLPPARTAALPTDAPAPEPTAAPTTALDLDGELARIAALEGVTADALLQGIAAQKQFHSTIQAMEQERAFVALLRQQAASEHAHAAAMDEQDIELLLTVF